MKTVKIEIKGGLVVVKGSLSHSWKIGVQEEVETCLKENIPRPLMLARVVEYLPSGFCKVVIQKGHSICSLVYREKGTPWGKSP